MPAVMDMGKKRRKKHKLQQGEKTYIPVFHNLLGGISLQMKRGENRVKLQCMRRRQRWLQWSFSNNGAQSCDCHRDAHLSEWSKAATGLPSPSDLEYREAQAWLRAEIGGNTRKTQYLWKQEAEVCPFVLAQLCLLHTAKIYSCSCRHTETGDIWSASCILCTTVLGHHVECLPLVVWHWWFFFSSLT